MQIWTLMHTYKHLQVYPFMLSHLRQCPIAQCLKKCPKYEYFLFAYAFCAYWLRICWSSVRFSLAPEVGWDLVVSIFKWSKSTKLEYHILFQLCSFGVLYIGLAIFHKNILQFGVHKRAHMKTFSMTGCLFLIFDSLNLFVLLEWSIFIWCPNFTAIIRYVSIDWLLRKFRWNSIFIS